MAHRSATNLIHTKMLEVVQFFNQLVFSKLLAVVLGPFSVEELVSTEDVPSICFARYRRKINILKDLGF